MHEDVHISTDIISKLHVLSNSSSSSEWERSLWNHCEDYNRKVCVINSHVVMCNKVYNTEVHVHVHSVTLLISNFRVPI